MESRTKAIGYVRISKADRTKSEDDQRHSINAQRDAIDKAAAANGWKLLHIYEDFSVSGATMHRPDVQAALAQLRNREASLLVLARFDRLSRDARDWLDLLFESSQQGWSISVLSDQIDTATATGWIHAALQAVFAEYERKLIGERTKAALAVVGRVKRLGRPSLVPDDVRARMVSLHQTGMSATAIAALFNETGVPLPAKSRSRRWHHSQVLATIRSAGGAA